MSVVLLDVEMGEVVVERAALKHVVDDRDAADRQRRLFSSAEYMAEESEKSRAAPRHSGSVPNRCSSGHSEREVVGAGR